MTYKIHLRRNTADTAAINGPIAACATNPYETKAHRNSRSSYQTIPASAIIDYRAFAAAPASERCSHCTSAMLTIRNRQRRAKGLAPLTNPFQGINLTA